MSLLQSLKNFFIGDDPLEEPPALGMDALPIAINPTPTSTLDRQLGRLLNLYRVRQPTQNTRDAIEAYCIGIRQHGYEAPRNEDETLALIERVNNGN